ncbi:MAG: hypothetical protein LLF97_11980 [Planctomycetaceae bacterium]|nr:hypothetical protein [Planctomycetaceae bacterium]
MLHAKRIGSALVCAAGLLFVEWCAGADVASTTDAKSAKAAAAPAAKPVKKLTPEQEALRDRVRATLATQQKPLFNTQQNSAAEIINCCLAFGCNSEVQLDGDDGKPINGITCLCWNYPCAGREMLGFDRKHIAARVGYGYQQYPGEFLATLALSRVPATYPVRSGRNTRTVADLVEAEKLGCRAGEDLSLKLIGLAFYVDEPQWKNDLGETWSIERMIREEMAQPVVTASEGGLNRLMGLSYAVDRRVKRGQPVDGQYQRAKKFTTDFQEFALQLQNSDGSWGPYFLAARSAGGDPSNQLRSSGRILEWLVYSLPASKLEDARVMRAVDYVNGLLSSDRFQWGTPSLSTREITAVGHALHALQIYDSRVFRPADVAVAVTQD